MDRSSVRLRLLAAAGFAVVMALAAAGWGLEVLFQRHVERRATEELKTDLRALLAGLEIDDTGGLTLARRPSDQRYSQAFSGLYWQIYRGGSIIERSRSLWDEQLLVPNDTLPAGGYHAHVLDGPNGQSVLAVEQAVSVTRGRRDFLFRAMVAVDRRELVLAVDAFRSELIWGLGTLALALLGAFWAALGVGLAPLARLRSALGLLRSGQASRLSGAYPSEIQPLVNDLNDLLARQEDMIARAQTRSGNLAHGLKTPLTAISVMAEELAGHDQHATARELSAHVSVMQRHLEHELALSRSAASLASARPVPLHAFVDRLVDTMRRLPRGPSLAWEAAIDDAITVAIDEITLGEIVGNILDNARKWAAGRVRIEAFPDSGRVAFMVSDDGPGVPAAEQDNVIDRGKRLDEAMPGTGLGLSIVADIVGQLGGRIELSSSDLGGLRVRVTLPTPAQCELDGHGAA
jgi:signal transduction histidine kinase